VPIGRAWLELDPVRHLEPHQVRALLDQLDLWDLLTEKRGQQDEGFIGARRGDSATAP
jgi:hypothetical protein